MPGGIGNAGQVVRVGDTVRRPWSPFTDSVHAWLRHVRAAGFEAVPEPLGRDEDGREVLAWIDGDVAIPPYPDWVGTDEFVLSVARQLRAMHDATTGFDPTPYAWSSELSDEVAGPVMCHNDLCLENLVAARGRVKAFLDFDFLAPGRAVTDVAATCRFVVPLRSPARRDPWVEDEEVLRRLRVFVDAYGLGDEDRAGFVTALEQRNAMGARFVTERARRGQTLFAHWLTPDGLERLRAEQEWVAKSSERIRQAVSA